ncbi:hypothetical protein [Gilvimarinus chinensis]|uniref:hypothetical protein n=1 Tax=Gilvimarinus chinensis TaxID=396005 RepID=UPI000375E43B|nr:hypothetical protein [Gilvimarinus chinensis]
MNNEPPSKKIVDLAKALAAYFPSWRLNKIKADEGGRLEFIGERGAAFCLRLRVDEPRGKVCIYGAWPGNQSPNTWGVLGHGEPVPAINVSINRSALSIANDIKRRFLPDYLALYSECLIAQQARQVQCDEIQHQVDAFMRIAPVKHLTESDPSRPRLFLPGYEMGADFRLTSRNRWSVELTGLSPDLAMQVLGLVAAARQKRNLKDDEN